MQQKIVAVTGANGFIGLHIVDQLLKNSFKVVATVRDAKNPDKIKDLLALPNSQNIKIVSADLQKSDGFLEAFQNVDAVIHNACPVFYGGNEEDFLPPALQGVENAMNSVLKNTNAIKNVVYISSTSAVCGAPGSKPKDYVFSADDWSDPDNQRERKSWYSLAKTLAEQKFNSYIPQLEKENIKCVSICPTFVTGPLLGSQITSSINHLKGYLTGETQTIANFSMSIVDVRDVGFMCVQAIQKNAEGRYLGIEKGYTMENIVEALRVGAGEKGGKITTKVAEGEKAAPTIFNLEKSIQLLGRPFISGQQSIIDQTQ